MEDRKMNNSHQKIALNFAAAKTIEPEGIAELGKTLIVAPHPDDESLGCGGAISLLRATGVEVIALAISDGTLSHPNSIKFPPKKLRDLREREMMQALRLLDVEEEKITFWRLPDRRVPNADAAQFPLVAAKASEYLQTHLPQTILVPWRRDPHPDHRATWQIFNCSVKLLDSPPRLLEYPIWLWEMAEAGDFPRDENIKMHRLNIEKVLKTKQRAIRAHESQITNLIDDDPQGFRLSEEVLAHFAVPFEIYFEETN